STITAGQSIVTGSTTKSVGALIARHLVARCATRCTEILTANAHAQHFDVISHRDTVSKCPDRVIAPTNLLDIGVLRVESVVNVVAKASAKRVCARTTFKVIGTA